MAGSFMSTAGGITPALQEALQRRQGGAPAPGGVMNQVSTSAPTFDASQQPPIPPTGGTPSLPASSGSPTGGLPMQGGSALPAGDPNATLIIKALSSYLNKK